MGSSVIVKPPQTGNAEVDRALLTIYENLLRLEALIREYHP
jgi:hypothetical protein